MHVVCSNPLATTDAIKRLKSSTSRLRLPLHVQLKVDLVPAVPTLLLAPRQAAKSSQATMRAHPVLTRPVLWLVFLVALTKLCGSLIGEAALTAGRDSSFPLEKQVRNPLHAWQAERGVSSMNTLFCKRALGHAKRWWAAACLTVWNLHDASS